MKSKNQFSGLEKGSLLCILLLICGGANCNKTNVSDQSVLTVDASDLPPPLESSEVTIAKCLSSKGVVLYGASWCPYTQKQISYFKDGFQYLNYVECTKQDVLCDANGVKSYPTWIVGGKHIVGLQLPREISQVAGCSW